MNSCFKLLRFIWVLFSIKILKLGSSLEKNLYAISSIFLFIVAEHITNYFFIFFLSPSLKCCSISLQSKSSFPASRNVSISSITNVLKLLINNLSPSLLYYNLSRVETRQSTPALSLSVSILWLYPEYMLKNLRGT